MRGAFLASVARWPALAGVFCGVGTSRGGRQKAPYGTTPFCTAQATWELRVAVSLASARMQHRRRGLARAERVLYRRQAVRPFRRGQAVTLPPVLSWTLKWHHCST